MGRYLLDLHKEDPRLWRHSDALCDALQVINHLQDCGADYVNLKRVYLPADWLRAEGADISDLAKSALTPGLRKVLDRCLVKCSQLIEIAAPFPGRLKNVRLGLESAVIIALARRLIRELKARDPLAERVVLSKAQMLGVGLGALLSFFFYPSRGAHEA